MGCVTIYDEEHWREEFEHRAAILEYDGGLTRKEAERDARTWLALERLRVASEGVQAQKAATRPATAVGRPAEQQATLPGFEPAYQGG